MSKIISVHSFRGGTGKSNTTANISALLASRGLRVCAVDTDIQSPGIHVLFGLEESETDYAINHFLWDQCDIDTAAYDMTERVGIQGDGKLFLVPGSVKPADITRILRDGYDVGLLNDGFQDLIDALDLDVLMIDTHPGLNEETLLSIAISDTLLLVMRPDQQDIQGTGVTVDVARRLGVPDLVLIVNKAPGIYDLEVMKADMAATYNCHVGAVLAHSDDLMVLASNGIFVLHYPNDPIARSLQQVVEDILS